MLSRDDIFLTRWPAAATDSPVETCTRDTLLIKYRALLIEYMALLTEYKTLLIDIPGGETCTCDTLLMESFDRIEGTLIEYWAL